MYLLVLFFPLISAIFCLSFGTFISYSGGIIIIMLTMLVTLCLALTVFYEVVLCKGTCDIYLGSWIKLGILEVNWQFKYDVLTTAMFIVVIFISVLVHLYSIDYMRNDPHKLRFFSYLSLFTFFMLFLVASGNFLQMFVGWEGVGLSSYLLINFWYTRYQANKSALKAIIVNRFGDFGIYMAISSLFNVFLSLDYDVIFSLVNEYIYYEISFFFNNVKILTFISLFIFLGAVGKSAQLGLHTWLPDAMEGPTPVSALIHAATMVTAGVYLLIRCSLIIEYSKIVLIIITLVGASTAFFSASVGLVQNDLKRVIAYSTCSQLGYMVFCCGLSGYSVAFFHLFNHAFFKALLFLSAGSVIHSMSDEQDMRKLGGLYKIMPFTYSTFLVGSLSLMGLPFLTGFYSKDVILELSYSSMSVGHVFSYWLGILGAFFTSFYSIRLLFFTFLNKPKGPKINYLNAHEGKWQLVTPLFILGFLSIFIGYLFKDLFIGIGTDVWNNSLYFCPENITILNSEFTPFYIKLIPVIFSIWGVVFVVYINFYINILYFYNFKKQYKNIYIFLSCKWFFDVVYNFFIVKILLKYGYHVCFKVLDRGFLEIWGPLGITRILRKLPKNFSKAQSGFLYHYTLILVVGLTVFITLVYSNILLKNIEIPLLFFSGILINYYYSPYILNFLSIQKI